MSHFFAYMARMKFIERWGLMRNTDTEKYYGAQSASRHDCPRFGDY